MELKYIILTIIKILISVPTILVIITTAKADASAFVGDHRGNGSSVQSANLTAYEFKIDLTDDAGQDLASLNATNATSAVGEMTPIVVEEMRPSDPHNEEAIPDPSALVVPGYNLPESIFNKGKPFYLEKDPITGTFDFNSKSPSLKMYDEYEYVDEEPGYDIYDKANINRKDGSLSGSHKPSDINQLTPNFHDFLNLPVKYNSDKYVYPLISNSYANTKVQGNVNKIHNHKDYTVTTYKPNYNPTYYTTKNYFGTTRVVTTSKPTTTSTTTTWRPINVVSTKSDNLMNSPMNHPSYGVPLERTTQRNIPTTKRPMSLFEQLFGDYEEEMVTTEAPLPITTTRGTTTTSATTSTTTTTEKHEIYNGNKITNGHMASPSEDNILTGSNMEHESAYEYDDDYTAGVNDNIMVENKDDAVKVKLTTMPDMTQTTIVLPETTTMRKIIYPVHEVDFQDGVEVTGFDIQKVHSKTETPVSITTSNAADVTAKIVTSLPLGENHVTHRSPIIVATQNLREKLNNERVQDAKPFSKNGMQQVPSTSNIHIAPDQDTVSFVVGHQQNVDGNSAGGAGQYQGTSLKESPYDSNPFRPVYSDMDVGHPMSGYSVEEDSSEQEIYNNYNRYPEREVTKGSSSVTIQPIRSSEASLSIGVPLNTVNVKPGQVVDDQLQIQQETIEFPKGNGPKIVFPDDKPTTYAPHLAISPPKTHQQLPNREILQLSSKPMLHQLPSDLTPPLEREVIPLGVPLPRPDRVRPPWDPRPGHFHQGRPEYARPPRPPTGNEIFKRIDTLPNILPQFRPNMGHVHHNHPPPPPHYHPHQRIDLHKNYVRQPLLERPSNRPIGFFEKLHPPPPPPKNLQSLRKIPPHELEQKIRQPPVQTQAEDRIINVGLGGGPPQLKNNKPIMQEPLFGFLNTPPKVMLPNRRNGFDDPEVETLQMIQAKQSEIKKEKEERVNVTKSVVKANMNGKDSIEKPLYVVYPVNTPHLKLDTVDYNKKETVVVGTRAELPLPPSKINGNPPEYVSNTEFNFDQTDRHDSPILKPHPRPSNYPIKSDFPYPLERPDPSILNPPVADAPNNENNLESLPETKLPDEPHFVLSNQWNTIEDTEARIVNAGKINTQSSNQISATLKTFTEKPIAVAYTPTESAQKDYHDKYSMPNYASLVIPEIRPEDVHINGASSADNTGSNSEFTVSAVMHTHPQLDLATQNMAFINRNQQQHRLDEKIEIDEAETTNRIPQLEFQAPFQASANIDSPASVSQGWSVIHRNRESDRDSEGGGSDTTVLPAVTTKEFDIENFKPQLEGGFKPIYSYPDGDGKDMQVNERQE